MGRDLQFARTDRAIVDAVLRLLAKKPLEKITVADVTAEALVNRSTFYQHYADKYEVLERLQERYMDEIIERTAAVRAAEVSDISEVDAVFGAFFDEHRDVLRLLFSIKTDTFDLQVRLERGLRDALLRAGGTLSPVEIDMMSGMGMRFFGWYLTHEKASGAYSTLFFQSCLDIALYSFGLGGDPNAKDELLSWIRTKLTPAN